MRGIRSDNMEGLGTAALCPEQVGVFTVCVTFGKHVSRLPQWASGTFTGKAMFGSKTPPSLSNVSQKQNKTFSFGMVIYNLEF